MKEELLFPDERIITQSDKNKITLTNHRLRFMESYSGKGYIMSVMLEKISHIEVKYQSFPSLLILAILVAGSATALGIAEKEEGILFAGISAGIILFILYLLLKKHILQISTVGNGKIAFHTRGMKSESVLKFVNQLENAILLKSK